MSALGRSLPVVTKARAGQGGCKRWRERLQLTGQRQLNQVVKSTQLRSRVPNDLLSHIRTLILHLIEAVAKCRNSFGEPYFNALFRYYSM